MKEDPLTVPDGTDLDLAVSAMSKHLRRGRELEALYWAQQIEARYWRYVWRRLLIFSSEDIGLANPLAAVTVHALAAEYEQARKHSRAPRPDANILSLAVVMLARSPKNREADDLKNTLHELCSQGWSAPVPDEAIDGHTKVGRNRMPDPETRSLHWLYVASKVEPDTGSCDWRLWLRRAAVRRGEVRAEVVDAEATAWHEQGRLRYGLEGYPIPPSEAQ